MPGDAAHDAEAVFRVGCKPPRVRTGKREPMESNAGIPVYDNLADFVDELDDAF
jgi:hypothetical protein